ncbi:sugar-binding protein [Gardnerella sp. DNF01180P]|uniref:sugar-binding protein n=1 Tax=Gardnerella sp. DNF01180P TaxID=2749062 RepID=UPI003BAB4509
MVKKTQAAKNALHVSKNYAYLKPSTLRSMAKEISGTRLEACKSYAVSRLPKIAVTATLASLLACGAGLPTHQAWANGFNLPDGSYRYANRDSSTKAQRYVDIKLVPCDEKQNDNKETADRKTYGQYYKVEYQFNSQGEWWGGRPFWWASVPKGVDIVDNKITLYKDEQLTGDSSSQQTGATYTKESWNQSASRFWFDNNKEQGTEFKNNWERMTGEAGGYDESGNTLGTSREYKDATSALIINWESRGNRKSKISFVIKLNDKTKPLKFAAGVYQVMGNWHYTAGKVALAPTLPKYSQELELTYPTDKVEVDSSTYGNNLSEDEKKAVLTKLWEANKSNTNVLKKLNGMPETPTEAAFKKAVTVNADGSATVTYKDNSTDTISKENLTKRYVPLSERTKITYPDLTPVKNPSFLDLTEKKQVENAIKNANSKIKDLIEKVDVAANGDATITFKDATGTHSTKKLEGKYLVKKQRLLADKFTPLYGLPIGVKNTSSLSPDDIKKVQDSIYDANKNVNGFLDAINNNKNNISIAANGDATITYKDNENSFPSKDTISHTLLVYKIPSLSERVKIAMPSRLGVKNAEDLSSQEQNAIKDNIKKANKDLNQNLKKDANAINVGKDGTTTITFSDDSTVKIRGERLVYTQGKSTAQGTHKVTTGKYTYNITPIKVTNINNIDGNNWADAARRFMFDNYNWKNKGTEFNKINHTEPLATGGSNIASNNKWDLEKQASIFTPKSDTSGLEINVWGKPGITNIVHGSSGIEIRGASSTWNNDDLYFTLSKDDLFYADGPAFNPEDEKKKIDDAIEKALKDKGFSGDELNKLKNEISKDKDVLSDKNGIKKQDDVDKLLKKIDELVDKKKEESDNKKQIDKAKKDLGLDDKQKKELDEQLKGVTDPEKIREKINEFQKKQDQQKQTESDDKQEEVDQKQKQAVQTQQNADNTAVDQKQQQAIQEENTSNQQAEEAKKKAELEKQKQAAIDEISNGEDYKNLTPEDKQQFIEKIQKATDANAINDIKQEAKEKANKNQTAADNSNKEGLDKAKADAKKKIGELTNLNEQDKQKYQDEVGKTDSLDKVAEILNNAEFEDAKAAAKKKIADLKKHGDLTDQEATNFNAKLDDKNTDSIQDIDSILQEAELAKTRKDANTAIDNLQNLNNAQKKALKEEVANPETDPKSDLDTVDKVKTAINNVVTKAKDLDGKMKSLKDLVTLVNGQKSTLTAKSDYKDNKKTAFDSALKAAEDLVKTDSAENKTADEVDEISKTLEKAVKDLGGNTIDKSKLQTEIETAYELQGKNKQGQDDSSKKKNPKYENASTEKKNDFDTALSEAKKVYDQKDASQQSINDAESKLSKAIDALDGHNKSDLNDAIKKAKSKKSEIAYKNASTEKKNDFDKALSNAESIEKKAGALDTEISNAKDELDNAINGLDGKVKTDELQTAVDNAKKLTGVTTPKSQDAYKYENASEAKKSAFDKALQQAESAITEAKNAKSTKTPEQKQQAVNTALTALTKAVNELDGNDKSQLVAKLAEAKGKKNDASYKNASAAKQAALDNAITSAESIVKKAGATEKEISDATSALNNAVTGLDGHDTSALQAAVTAAESKKKTVAYMNASDTKKTAFDNAVAAAQAILDSPKGKTEQEISDAKTQLETASNALDGTVDTSKLQVEVNKADSLKKSVQYTNAVQDKKSAYDTALTAAESALADAKNAQSANTPEQKQIAVNGALLQLQTAAAALNGVDIADLQAEIALENSVKESVKYVYDTAEKQQAYNKALQDAKELISKLADPAGQGVEVATKSQADRQALVNTALKSLKNAKDALNGVNKTVLQAEVDDDSHFSKSFAYLLGETPDLDVYKKALAEAKRVLADPNATQAQVDAAVKNLSAARKALAAAKAHAADVHASVRAQVLKSGSVAQLSKTGSDVSVFGLFAATLSAAGAALFSTKRRGTSRHSSK